MEIKEKEYLSVKEFAVKIGLHPNTVRNMIKKGKINALSMGCGTYEYYRIPHSELNRLAYNHLEKVVKHFIDKKQEEKTG